MSAVTQNEVVRYAKVVEAVWARKRVRLLLPDGNILEGTLRAITPADENPNFLPPSGDLRTAWVRITTRGGWEKWVPFTDITTQVDAGGVSFE